MCLGAQQAQAGEPIVLVRADGPLTKDWIWSGESIVCAQDPSLRIGPNATNTAMQLQAASESDPGQHWEKQEAPDNEAKPATSCYLNYDGVTDSDIIDSWVLECTANVKESSDSTYYCMVGWGPGGYSGIQRKDGKSRLVIFSMWNDDDGNMVQEVEHGDGVTVDDFGGEGTGMRSTKSVDWVEDEDVALRIEGVKVSTSGDLEVQLLVQAGHAGRAIHGHLREDEQGEAARRLWVLLVCRGLGQVQRCLGAHSPPAGRTLAPDRERAGA